MPPFEIIEALDVAEYIGLGLVPYPIDLTRYTLGLERGKEALHRRIVPDIARAAHGTDDAVIGHQPLELLAGVLAATVGVMQQRIGLALRQIAIISASVTSCAVMVALIDQPTARRENRSMTAAT